MILVNVNEGAGTDKSDPTVPFFHSSCSVLMDTPSKYQTGSSRRAARLKKSEYAACE